MGSAEGDHGVSHAGGGPPCSPKTATSACFESEGPPLTPAAGASRPCPRGSTRHASASPGSRPAVSWGAPFCVAPRAPSPIAHSLVSLHPPLPPSLPPGIVSVIHPGQLPSRAIGVGVRADPAPRPRLACGEIAAKVQEALKAGQLQTQRARAPEVGSLARVSARASSPSILAPPPDHSVCARRPARAGEGEAAARRVLGRPPTPSRSTWWRRSASSRPRSGAKTDATDREAGMGGATSNGGGAVPPLCYTPLFPLP